MAIGHCDHRSGFMLCSFVFFDILLNELFVDEKVHVVSLCNFVDFAFQHFIILFLFNFFFLSLVLLLCTHVDPAVWNQVERDFDINIFFFFCFSFSLFFSLVVLNLFVLVVNLFVRFNLLLIQKSSKKKHQLKYYQNNDFAFSGKKEANFDYTLRWLLRL